MTVLWVWVPMLDSDSLRDATEMSVELGGLHFWDGDRFAARSFGNALNGDGELAWDVYLFFRPASVWTEPAPVPTEWAHQLGRGSWADPGKFAWGEALVERLRSFVSH